LIYNVQQRTTNTLFTIDGEWHAPNWTPKGQYIVSDMGGELYRIPVSGSNAGKPEKINVSLRMMITNDHALSWDGKQIAVTGITPPMPAKIRNAGGRLSRNFVSTIHREARSQLTAFGRR